MRLHPDKVTEIVPRVYKNTKNFRFTCGFCSRNFNSKNHLNYHLKSHGVTQGNVTLNQQKCPLCDYCDPLKKQLIIHFQEIHNIEIVLESRDFPSRSVFDEWKSILEEENSCKFIKQFSKSLSNGTLTEYICHRSGKFISKGKGLRRLKTQGSNKINGFCPAKIRLVEDDERKCSVRFISKHVGHTNDLSHVTLTADERQVIASKIISNVSFDNIINEIQTSATDDIKRIHLITRKDLHNIKQEYSVNSSSAVKHSQNALGGFDIDTWINQLGQTTDCVLYYKSQQDLDVEHIELKSEDFILIIMNEGQCDILKRYASNCIYIDGISSSNGSNFDLITLMVFDDMLQVFPCAFLITNRMDEEVLKMFFRCIRQRTACLTSRIFLSDASDSFYNAWRQIMGETRYNLYCTWHLDKAWQQNLRVIESKARQRRIKVHLKKMLGEFYNEMLEDPETLEFALYFDYYMKLQKLGKLLPINMWH
ncbi:hypothetical protein NQ317_006017 [Molorchus minor]|uniref:C2H2-type domain-containing protein n=1 Tax=Molorchus minor TaxID=1323400 RepID=A0ABQ9J2L7_9CUCU|nr:hypothetical protein NQ317_006017 [Molorchus minor]